MWAGSAEDDKDDSHELLGHRPSTRSTITNDWTTVTSRLSPKTLPLRTTTQVVRRLFWTGILAIIIIIGLGVLIRMIPYFLPHDYSFDLDSKISCDLSTNQGGKLQNAFALNLRGATHLSFTEARAIDVIWQLFVGAGGRFALAWVSYVVFMDGLTRLTEHTPVAYNLFATLTFSTTSIWSTYFALKAVYSSKGWRSKLFLLWFSLSTIYVLGFPTLMSATAGYVSPSTAGYKMSDGNFLTPDSDGLRSCYVVHHGALIGQTNETIAPGPPVSVINPVSNEALGGYSEWPGDANFNKTYPLYASLLNCKNTNSSGRFRSSN